MTPSDFEKRGAEQRRDACQRQEHERQNCDRFHGVAVLLQHLAVSLRDEVERQTDYVGNPLVQARESELSRHESGLLVAEL